jgi:hypothetical protein
VLPLRPSYEGDPVPVRLSSLTSSDVTRQAKSQVALDVAWARANLDEAKKQVSLHHQSLKRSKVGASALVGAWWGLSKREVNRTVKDANTNQVTPQKRSGRKRSFGEVQMKEAVDFLGASTKVPLRRTAAKLQGNISGYRVKSSRNLGYVTGPAKSTIHRRVKAGEMKFESMRVREVLTASHKEKRVKHAQDHIGDAQDEMMEMDEAMTVHALQRGYWALPGIDSYETDDARKKYDKALQDITGQDAATLFLVGFLSKPKISNPTECGPNVPATFDTTKKHVILYNLRGQIPRKNKKWETLPGGDKKLIHGPPGSGAESQYTFTRPTMDGQVYRLVMLTYAKDAHALAMGTLSEDQRARNLFVPWNKAKPTRQAAIAKALMSLETELKTLDWSVYKQKVWQIDGAPGHGFNNLHGKKKTEQLLALEKFVKETCGVSLLVQPSRSPDTNVLDIGFWHMLKANLLTSERDIPERTVHNKDVVEMKMWEVVRKWALSVPERHLFNLFEQKKVQLQQMIDNNGDAISREEHSGIRQKFGTYEPRLRDDVTSVASSDE